MADHLGSRRRLRPGLRVVRRDHTHLQAGLAPEHATLLRSPARDAGGPAEAPVPEHLLLDTGLLDRTSCDAQAHAALAAVVVDHGEAAGDVLAARRAASVRLEGLPEDLAALTSTLRPAGVVPHQGAPHPDDDLVVMVRRGEPPREHLDDLIRAGTPHLLLTAVEDTITLGPCVVPGRTACLRCVDAAHAETDPRRPVVVAQYAEAPGPLRADGVPDPLDPALWAAALGLAGHDALRLLDGGVPTTWSATLHLCRTGPPAVRPWRRHPACGCAWADGLQLA